MTAPRRPWDPIANGPAQTALLVAGVCLALCLQVGVRVWRAATEARDPASVLARLVPYLRRNPRG